MINTDKVDFTNDRDYTKFIEDVFPRMLQNKKHEVIITNTKYDILEDISFDTEQEAVDFIVDYSKDRKDRYDVAVWINFIYSDSRISENKLYVNTLVPVKL